MSKKCPVVLISGFLGSGKTTLLTRILKNKDFEGAAVIVNEYGTVGLDHRLLYRIEDNTTLLSEGCVCCQKKEALVTALKNLLFSSQNDNIPLKWLFIESSGLADPAPIMFSILQDPLLVHHFYIDRVITCVDALNAPLHWNYAENLRQIAAGDAVVLTKTTVSSPHAPDSAALKLKIAALTPTAALFTDTDDIAAIFKTKTHPIRKPLPSTAHLSAISSISISFTTPLNWNAFGIWMSLLLHSYGEQILRIKGWVDVGADGPVALNGVQHIIHPPTHLPRWEKDETRLSQLVFIAKDLDTRKILHSLNAFKGFLGSEARIQECR